jgi:hypothetical protein
MAQVLFGRLEQLKSDESAAYYKLKSTLQEELCRNRGFARECPVSN